MTEEISENTRHWMEWTDKQIKTAIKKSTDPMLAAIGEILVEERNRFSGQIAKLAKRVDGIDGSALLTSAAVSVIEANCRSIDSWTDAITNRKASPLDGGTMPAWLEERSP